MPLSRCWHLGSTAAKQLGITADELNDARNAGEADERRVEHLAPDGRSLRTVHAVREAIVVGIDKTAAAAVGCPWGAEIAGPEGHLARTPVLGVVVGEGVGDQLATSLLLLGKAIFC